MKKKVVEYRIHHSPKGSVMYMFWIDGDFDGWGFGLEWAERAYPRNIYEWVRLD